MESYSFYLKHPFTMLIAGPTGSGKTMWVKKLIDSLPMSSCDRTSHRQTGRVQLRVQWDSLREPQRRQFLPPLLGSALAHPVV